MASYYTIIQFAPSSSIDERLNAGLLVFGQGRILSHFINDSKRLSRFSGQDTSFFSEFVRDIAFSVRSEVFPFESDGTGRLDEIALRTMIRTWKKEIRFTPLRGSILTVDQLYEEIVSQYIRIVPPRETAGRTRRYVANETERTIASLLSGQAGIGPIDELLFRNTAVKGKRDNKKFDVVVQNGSPWLVANALSFERGDTVDLDKTVDATLWAVKDIVDENPYLPVAVVNLPPRGRSEIFDRTNEILKSIGVPFISDNEVADWANPIILSHAV